MQLLYDEGFDVRRDFSLFPKNSDSKFGFRIRGTVF